MTLVELLVVVGILMLLTVIVVPRLQPATEQRAIREAARSVNTYLCAARNEAVASGRPVGVIFHRGFSRPDPSTPGASLPPEQPGVCRKIEQIELPAAFGGRNEDSVVRVQDWTWFPHVGGTKYYYANNLGCGPNYLDYRYATIILRVLVRFDPGAGDITDLANGTIRYGDQIQLGGKGPWYTIIPSPHPQKVADFPLDPNDYLQFSGAGATDSTGDGWVDNAWLTLALEPGSLARVAFPLAPRVPTHDPNVPDGNWSVPISFCIQPQPYLNSASGAFSFAALASAADTLTLPAQAAIDLTFSGFDTVSRDFRPRDIDGTTAGGKANGVQDDTPIVVMFSPTGSVMGVYTHAPPTPAVPNPPFDFIRNPEIIHFLFGRLDAATDDNGDGFPDGGDEVRYNVEDENNFWVSINPQSGNVVTTPVATSTTYSGTRLSTLRDTSDRFIQTADEQNYVRETRRLARETKSMGGR